MSNPLLASIVMFAGNFAPRGWALCQGQILSIAQNTALFSILGTTYGGNGQTTFALPDLRSRVPVGQGQGPGLPAVQLGEVAGAPTHTMIITEMPAHTHSTQVTLKGTSITANLGTPDNAIFASNDNLSIYSRNTTGVDLNFNSAAVSASIGIAGGSQPFSIMPPYLGINYIIALQGVFPSRN